MPVRVDLHGFVATVTDGRWACPQHPELARILDKMRLPASVSRADGDWAHARHIAEVLNGTILDTPTGTPGAIN